MEPTPLTAADRPDARPAIRLAFAGFWDSFDPRDNFLTRLLESRWRIELVDEPDFLIHSCIGRGRHDHRRHDCVRIFYTGENVPPDWLSTDWAFTFEYTDHPRHFRLPHWPFYIDPPRLVKGLTQDAAAPAIDVEAILAARPRFCGFVVSNPLCKVRNEFFRRLSRYKQVDSGGKLFNNVGGRVADKRAFLAECRFTIAFENESHPGYTSEKVAEPMLVNTIPIYWGDPLVGNDFDTRSFLSFHDTPPDPGVSASAALDLLVDRVVAADRDPAVYAAMLARPWYRGDRVPRCADAAAILTQFERIFTTPIDRVSRRRGPARQLGLDRVPDALRSIRFRLKRKWRQWTA
ncbi:MAG: glycosyltransferase family 10 domain-containing protein [Planctomycetota bacterium]